MSCAREQLVEPLSWVPSFTSSSHPDPAPSRDASRGGILQLKSSSEADAFSFRSAFGAEKMLHHVFNSVEHSIPDPGGPWEQMSLVMFSIQKIQSTKEKKRQEMPSYEYALT